MRNKSVNCLSLQEEKGECFQPARSEKALPGLGQAGAGGCVALSAGQISWVSHGSLEASRGKGKRQKRVCARAGCGG